MRGTGVKTLIVVRDFYPSKKALDEAAGAMDAMPETLDQLEDLLGTLGASVGG